MFNKKEFTARKIYARCHILVIVILAVVSVITWWILKTIPSASEVPKDKAMSTYIIYLCISILTIVIWAVGMCKVLDDLILVYNLTGHPILLSREKVAGWVQYAKISIFTGEQVICNARIVWHPRIFYPILSRLISKKFENHVKHNKELQAKYYDEQVYNADRKLEVKNTIANLCVDVSVWEMMSIIYLLINFICIFFLIFNIMS